MLGDIMHDLLYDLSITLSDSFKKIPTDSRLRVSCTFNSFFVAELTVQHELTPQPPPPPPQAGAEVAGENPLPIDGLNVESIFFTSFEPQAGHIVSFSEDPRLCNAEKILLHFLQVYS